MRRAIPILLLVLVACGGAQKERALDDTRAGMSTALAATNLARETFLAYSKTHELGIVDRADSREEGERDLALFRSRADRVVRLFVVAYTAIAAAASAADLARSGSAADVVHALKLARESLAAVLALKQAVAALEGGTP